MPSCPSLAQSTCVMEQAHGLVIKTSLSRSAKRRSNAALWAMTRAAPLANDATSSASIFRPATISSVMPVIMVSAAEIGGEGSWKGCEAERIGLGWAAGRERVGQD